MTSTARIFAALVLAAIAAFLVIYAWVPARHQLRNEEGRVAGIVVRPNTWYEVEIVTASGARLSCRTRRGWPLLGPSRCPLEPFEAIQGREVRVVHDGKRPYEVVAGDRTVLGYAAFRQGEKIAIAIAVMLLAVAFWVWRGRDGRRRS